jgi:two-component system LytT family sensor kinase
LNRELEGLTIYLEIEKIRFQDRLTVETKIAPATRECLVPFMILQPLAENAVRHGISRITRPGRILIESTLQKGFLEFEILNDGPIQAAQPSEGLGLRNSRDRLQALYRDNYTLEYGPLPEGGWRVHLRIPESRSAMPDAYNQIAKANGY